MANVATVADLWFSPTDVFVDLTIQANRRLFISEGGAAQSLGAAGEAPTTVSPPVFLRSNGTPASFAANSGRGHAFALSSGSLTAGGSNPVEAVETTTSYAPSPTSKGVVGDYRTGNIYAWNPATLTDDGTRKVWRRRWRAVAQSSDAPKRFSALVIGMQTGVNVPNGTAPQVMLRWSDDGGSTWSDQRIVAVGGLGKTRQTVKFNRLGMTRRFGGSDRIFELSSADEFEVAILDAEVDVA